MGRVESGFANIGIQPGARILRLSLSTWILGSGTAVLVLVGLLVDDLSLLSLLTTVFMLMTMAQAWNILGGYAGYLNLGTAAFFGIGAYGSAIMDTSFRASPFLAVAVAGPVAAGFALLIAGPSLRVRGPYFAILTLIVTFVVRALVFNLPITRGALGIFVRPFPFDPRTTEQIFYLTFLALALGVALLVRTLEQSRLGVALVAIREDEDAAEVLGVRTTRIKTLAFVAGAFLMGLCGGLHAYKLAYVEPFGVFAIDLSIDVLLATVVGGAGTWVGPLVGVPLVEISAEILRVGITHIDLFGQRVPIELNRIVFGSVLITLALLNPNGIVGLVRRSRVKRAVL